LYQTVPSWEREAGDVTDSTTCGPFVVKKSLSAFGGLAAIVSVCLLFLTFYSPSASSAGAVIAANQPDVASPISQIAINDDTEDVPDAPQIFRTSMVQDDDEEDVSDSDPLMFAQVPAPTPDVAKATEDAKQASREALEKAKLALQAEIDRLANDLAELQQKHMPQLESKLAQAKDKLVAINKQLSEESDAATSSAMSVAPVAAVLLLTLM